MTIAVVALATLSAALHVFIFYLEVFAWDKPVARKIFGPQSKEELAITSFYAYNQGVYNLALAVIAFAGAALTPSHTVLGAALALAGCGSMLLAALALGLKSPRHREAAVKQGTLPLLTVICAVLLLTL